MSDANLRPRIARLERGELPSITCTGSRDGAESILEIVTRHERALHSVTDVAVCALDEISMVGDDAGRLDGDVRYMKHVLNRLYDQRNEEMAGTKRDTIDLYEKHNNLVETVSMQQELIDVLTHRVGDLDDTRSGHVPASRLRSRDWKSAWRDSRITKMTHKSSNEDSRPSDQRTATFSKRERSSIDDLLPWKDLCARSRNT